MKELVRFAEQSMVVLGLLYLTGSLDRLLPGIVLSLTQYTIYGFSFLLLLARGSRTVGTAIRSPFLCLLLAIALASFLWSDFPSYSLRNSIVACQTALFALYVASCYSLKQQIRLMAWALGIAALLTVFYTLAFPNVGIHRGLHEGAWRGVYAQKNILAQIATLSSVVFLFLTMTVRRYYYIAWAGLFLSIALLLLSTSKTGLMVFLTLLILLQVYKALRWRNTKSILILNIIIFTLSAIALLLVSHADLVLNSLGRDMTLTGRTEIWAGAIARIQEQPWLGYGRGAFWHPQSGRAIAIGEEVAANYPPPHSHNGFIDLTCDLGLLGLFAFLLSYLTAWVRAYHRVRLTHTPEALWPLIYLSFLFLYNITESSIMKHNSALWATYMIVAFSLGRVVFPSEVSEHSPESFLNSAQPAAVQRAKLET